MSFAAGWAVSRTQAGVAEATVQVDTFQLMTNAKQMPAEHFADYSFVYWTPLTTGSLWDAGRENSDGKDIVSGHHRR